MARKHLSPLALLLCLTACDAPEEALDDVGPTSERIATENPGGSTAEIIARRYLVDPDKTMVSYAATGIVGACSATLIGPNLVLTAAHCGFKEHLFGFSTYRENDPAQRQVETVQCEPLYQTFSDTDMLLMYCPPIGGVNPGDKYGYVDLDPRPAQVGDRVYSIWKNHVDDVGGGEHMLYSDGEVIDDQAGSWTTPAGYDNTAILTDLYSIPGASGSAQFSEDRNEILVGPLSVGPGGGGPKRWSLSMFDYRSRAKVSDLSNVDSAQVQALGLNPGDYVGGTDKDADLQLDLQTDMERALGEGERDHYTMTFSSERQNAQWTTFPGVSGADFYADSGFVHMPAHGGVGQVEALRHEGLPLKPSTLYRVSLMVHANSDDIKGLEVGFDGDFGQYGWSPVDAAPMDLVKGTGWVMHTFELKSSWTPGTALTFRKKPGADVSIGAVNVIEQGSVMDFDLHDKRFHWRNDNNGDRAFILPDGTDPGVDWAGAIVRNDAITSGKDWPLRTRQLALLGERNYQLCFDTRKFSGTSSTPITGRVQVESEGVIVYDQMFGGSSTNWHSVCTDNFETLGPDNLIRFGIDATPIDQGVPTGAILLVDDLSLQEI